VSADPTNWLNKKWALISQRPFLSAILLFFSTDSDLTESARILD